MKKDSLYINICFSGFPVINQKRCRYISRPDYLMSYSKIWRLKQPLIPQHSLQILYQSNVSTLEENTTTEYADLKVFFPSGRNMSSKYET